MALPGCVRATLVAGTLAYESAGRAAFPGDSA
jgi:hypothetical protein